MISQLLRTLRRAFLGSIFVVLCAAAPGAADDTLPPDSATIYAKVRAAAGTTPLNYREVIDADQSNGVSRRETRYVLGESYRNDTLSGTIETQAGRDKTDTWHQNENGLTVLHELPPGVETPDAITTTVTKIATPVTGYRIARLNSRGNGTID